MSIYQSVPIAMISPTTMIIILVVVVLLFGGSKIPELMRGVGQGMGEFKKGVEEGKKPDDEPVKKSEQTS